MFLIVFDWFQIFSLMKRQSRKLTSSLEPKAENEEVISVKE